MKNIDNDMDELFNKAGQDYPLKTDSMNWDAVQKALAAPDNPPVQSAPGRNYRRFYPLLLLLVIPIFLFIQDNNGVNRGVSENKKNNTKNSVKIANSDPSIKTSIKEDKKVKKDEENKDLNNSTIESSNAPATENSTATGATTLKEEKKSNDQSTVIRDIVSVPDNIDNNSGNKTNNITGSEKSAVVNSRKTVRQNPAEQAPLENAERENIEPVKTPWTMVRDQQINNQLTSDKKIRTVFPPLASLIGMLQNPSAAITAAPLSRSYEQPGTAVQQKKKTTRAQPSFYYGVIGGPDFSSIKYQQVKNVGAGGGVLLGYRFSNHWSVEAAGLWSSKKYYTDGKYFDKTAARIPWNVNIHYLDGGCSMVEIPVALRYEFTPGKSTFFATAGLNSYLMKKENYNYKADAGGMMYSGYRDYKNSGNHLFSNLQISGGYQYKLFSKLSIRIEPYLQMPLKHVGIGKMPITSAGVHFGIMRETK